MVEPQCPQKAPYVKREEAGERWWCACGRSKTQPYCDGSHAGTGISPVRFAVDKPKQIAWCGCKRTKTPPCCDGSHARI
ncbi:MAG: CDGSH iron-sulfur domain-containing protein [Planctomycetes bacterium]|nr:CDGSH iron-sulfur domain-containing protein [Planctomycetota bacterium]